MATRTATPWQLLHINIPHAVPHEIVANVDIASDATSYTRICEMADYDPETNANAEFIVRAVNCHDDLLAAAIELKAAFMAGCGDAKPGTANRQRLANAGAALDAAIAKATGH